MKKYFYTDGSNQFGPFTLEELKEKNIARETLVWFQELGDWQQAGTVNELNELFSAPPPPITQATSSNKNINNYTNKKPPKTWLLESILVTLFCCLPFGIAGIVSAAKVESRFYAGDIDGANKSSKDAKKWTTVSFLLGIAVVVLYLFIAIITAASGY